MCAESERADHSAPADQNRNDHDQKSPLPHTPLRFRDQRIELEGLGSGE